MVTAADRTLALEKRAEEKIDVLNDIIWEMRQVQENLEILAEHFGLWQSE